MLTDPIADLLTRIRNAQRSDKVSVNVASSSVKKAILKVLQEEGYIEGFAEQQADGKPVLDIRLKYHDGEPVISTIKRFSKPGRRHYSSRDDLPKVAGGMGIAIVSTSKGIMTDDAAREAGIGGEVLCIVS